MWYLDDLQHLHPCDLAVSVQVVHVEGPVEFLLEAASWCDGQRTDELSEVNGAVAVLVESPEGMLGELGRVTVREELGWKKEKGYKNYNLANLTFFKKGIVYFFNVFSSVGTFVLEFFFSFSKCGLSWSQPAK